MRNAKSQADYERSIGIPDRLAYEDARDTITLDLSKHGGGNWLIEPMIGYTWCRLRCAESGETKMRGTLKQILRWLSRDTRHTTRPYRGLS